MSPFVASHSISNIKKHRGFSRFCLGSADVNPVTSWLVGGFASITYYAYRAACNNLLLSESCMSITYVVRWSVVAVCSAMFPLFNLFCVVINVILWSARIVNKDVCNLLSKEKYLRIFLIFLRLISRWLCKCVHCWSTYTSTCRISSHWYKLAYGHVLGKQ